MILRLLAAAIVLFWLVMTALLVRLEIAPAKSDLLEVPANHLVRLLFLHEQASDLNIIHAGQRIGNLTLHPEKNTDGHERLVTFGGNLILRGAGNQRQRISWKGTLELTAALEPRTLQLSGTLSDPASALDLSMDFTTHLASYTVTLDERIVEKSEVTLDEPGLRGLLDRLGIDPAVLAGVSTRMTAPTINARRGTFKIRSESIDAYRVIVKQGELNLTEIVVSQLGQILEAKTPFGYSLTSDDLTNYTSAP